MTGSTTRRAVLRFAAAGVALRSGSRGAPVGAAAAATERPGVAWRRRLANATALRDAARDGDRGFLLAGRAGTGTAAGPLVAAFDTDGAVRRVASPDLPGVVEFATVAATADGGHLLAGPRRGDATGEGVIALKLDAAGDRSWTVELPARSQARSPRVAAAGSDRYAVAWNEVTTSGSTGRVAALTGDGEVLWRRGFDGYGVRGLLAGEDGALLVGTAIGDGGPPGLARSLSAAGTVRWSARFADPGPPAQAADGGFAVAGVDDAHHYRRPALAGFDSGGNRRWRRTYARRIGFVPRGVVRPQDGGFVVAGRAYRTEAREEPVAVVLRTGPAGVLEWGAVATAGRGLDPASVLAPVSDRYLLAGTVGRADGDSEGWVVLLDESAPGTLPSRVAGPATFTPGTRTTADPNGGPPDDDGPTVPIAGFGPLPAVAGLGLVAGAGLLARWRRADE